MSRIIVLFSSVQTACCRVAGIPACARAVQQVGLLAGATNRAGTVVLAVPGGILADPVCSSEAARLVPGLTLRVIDSCGITIQPHDHVVGGENLVMAAASPGVPRLSCLESVVQHHQQLGISGLMHGLHNAGRLLVENAIKASDGIVSRHINRPISTRISRLLLNFVGMRPGHATAATALLALMMTLCLFSSSAWGLVAGAVLFQLASLIDGVDGEIARATQRTSARGAMLDTVTDGFTNFAFIAGLAYNAAWQGNQLVFAAGMIGAACLALGCLLLATHAGRSGDKITFDAVKIFLSRNPSPIRTVVIAIAMRDFFAFSSMVLVIAGMESVLLLALSAGAITWLITIGFVLTRQSGEVRTKA